MHTKIQTNVAEQTYGDARGQAGGHSTNTPNTAANKTPLNRGTQLNPFFCISRMRNCPSVALFAFINKKESNSKGIRYKKKMKDNSTCYEHEQEPKNISKKK